MTYYYSQSQPIAGLRQTLLNLVAAGDPVLHSSIMINGQTYTDTDRGWDASALLQEYFDSNGNPTHPRRGIAWDWLPSGESPSWFVTDNANGEAILQIQHSQPFTIAATNPAAIDIHQILGFGAVMEQIQTEEPTPSEPTSMSLQNILNTIAPLGHTIIALSEPPAAGQDTQAWVDHIEQVSGAIEQRGAILIVPFSNIADAEDFAARAPVKTNYRIVAACYHGADDQLPQIAAAMAAAIADSNDPAVPFNGIKLGLNPVDPQYELTFERIDAALNKGVAMIKTGFDGRPEIVRAISTYQYNPVTTEADDIMLDINGALVIDYTRTVMRTAARREPRRKNTAAQRKNLRSLFLSEAKKLDDAEILQNVMARKNELTVVENPNDRGGVIARIPADWVRGMHVIAAYIDVY